MLNNTILVELKWKIADDKTIRIPNMFQVVLS